MSVLLNALKKAADQQPSLASANIIHSPSFNRNPSQTIAPDRSPPSIAPHWQHIAERGAAWSHSSHLLKQRLNALQQKVKSHQQQLGEYRLALTQFSQTQFSNSQQPTPLTELPTKPPSTGAIEQLFQRQAVSNSQWYWPETSTLLSTICLASLCGLVGIIWQKELQQLFTTPMLVNQIAATPIAATSISTKPIETNNHNIIHKQETTNRVAAEAITASNQNTDSLDIAKPSAENNVMTDAKPLLNSEAELADSSPEASSMGNIEPDLASNTLPTNLDLPNNDLPNNNDVPIIFVEPRIPPQMTITKSKRSLHEFSSNQEKLALFAENAITPGNTTMRQQLLQDAQSAWGQQNKRAAAQSFKQYWHLVEQQPLTQQAPELQSSFQQLFNNGYFELAFYLLQADLQQGPLPSISIYHLFKLIPELPLETLEPFFVSLSKQHPDNSLLYFGLGNLYALHQYWQPALTQFTLATKYDPRNADAFFNAAISAEHLQKYHDAINAYQQALKLSRQKTFSFPQQIAIERLTMLKKRINE